MLEIFTYDFMLRALYVGLVVGVVAPLIGTFLVAKRYSLIADSLAHVSLAGVALGALLGVSPLLGALVVSVVAALVIEKLRSGRHVTAEVALAMFLSSGLALAVVLVGLSHKVDIDLFAYLFGSITTVTTGDIWIVSILGAAILGTIGLLFKQLTYVSFDEEQARASGLKATLINQVLMLLAAATVVLSLRIVGGLLIGALTVIPVAAAAQLANGFRQTMRYAVLFGAASAFIGLFLAFYLDLAAGGTIVLTALGLFFASLGVRAKRRAP